MAEQRSDFSEIVKEAMDHLKSLPGWRREFLSKFHKSEATVNNWRNGKTNASVEDQLHFIEVVTSISKNLEFAKIELEQRKASAIQGYRNSVLKHGTSIMDHTR